MSAITDAVRLREAVSQQLDPEVLKAWARRTFPQPMIAEFALGASVLGVCAVVLFALYRAMASYTIVGSLPL